MNGFMHFLGELARNEIQTALSRTPFPTTITVTLIVPPLLFLLFFTSLSRSRCNTR